jgi:hypothetical protein
VKVTDNIKFDKAANQLTMNGSVAGFDPSGNPLLSFPVTESFTRTEARWSPADGALNLTSKLKPK